MEVYSHQKNVYISVSLGGKPKVGMRLSEYYIFLSHFNNWLIEIAQNINRMSITCLRYRPKTERPSTSPIREKADEEGILKFDVLERYRSHLSSG